MNTLTNKITIALISWVVLFFTSCNIEHDEWEEGDPTMSHIYYYGFEQWGSIPGGNDVTYTMRQGETLDIPVQFYSKYSRTYSPMVFYYTTPDPEAEALICGTDYVVVDESGNTITPESSTGAYEMIWPNAEGGVQQIHIKALNGKKGTFRVLTFDPQKEMDVTDVTTTTIVKTNEYEVRAFSENYYVTVTIE